MKIELTKEQIELILTMAKDYYSDLYSIDYPEETLSIEQLINTIEKQA